MKVLHFPRVRITSHTVKVNNVCRIWELMTQEAEVKIEILSHDHCASDILGFETGRNEPPHPIHLVFGSHDQLLRLIED